MIINTSLSCGASLFGATWCEKALLFMNPNYNHPDNLSNFFVDNVTNDWGLLRSFLSISMDDVALLLHLVLSNSAASDYQSSPISFPSQNESDKSFSSMTHPAVRDYWEEFMDKQHISPLTCTKEMLHEKLTMANRMYGDSAELDGVVGLFANELQERVPLQAIEFSERCAIAPGLWRLAVSFSYEDFVMTLKQLTDGSERYPLLSLITNEDQHQLAVLRHIPAVIEWFRLLRVHYNGSIDRETSRLKVNEAVLDELSHGSTLVREKLDSLFHAYCLAWNDSWSNVLRFGCIKFSSDYNSLRMDLNTPLSFSLPNEFDEGNCPLSLIHYLIEKHNTFAQRVDESLLLRSRAKTVSSENLAIDRVPIISSRFMTSAHTIRCDITQDLLPLLEKHCVLHDNQSGFLGYDFAKAETLIIDRFLSDIPAIDLEMPGFRFAHENFLHGGMIVLRQKIKQHLLPQDIIRLIQREILTPVVAQQFIDLVEQAVSFISTTGGTLVQTLNENVGDMSLGQYMKSVLLLDDINVTISRVISDQVSFFFLF